MALKTHPKVSLHSSNRALEQGFERLKHQALHWVFEGYPVGDYYEAALPNRDAFCIRDVAHQCVGGEVLGLSSHNKNMFLKFARSISESRGWCGYWEIDRWDRPCPVDYTNDEDFWYNLPANFDVLDACWRIYKWTGDRDYITHEDFDHFYTRTMEDYIKTWDSNGDGIPDRGPKKEQFTRRGIPGYDEAQDVWNIMQTATDTVAIMTRAFYSYSEMCTELGRNEQAVIYARKASALQERLNRDFYTDEKGFARGVDFEGNLIHRSEYSDGGAMLSVPDTKGREKMIDDYTGSMATVKDSFSILYRDAVPDAGRREKMLDGYARSLATAKIEWLSHYPEVLWYFGRKKEAMASLLKLMDPSLYRKEYPEASFCAIGAVATGLMGVKPDASLNKVTTLSGLETNNWVELRYLPVLGQELSIRHEGTTTELYLEGSKPILWQPNFYKGSEVCAGNLVMVTPGEVILSKL